MSISDLILDVCSSDRVISGYTGNSRPRRAGATAGSFSQQQFPSAHIFPSREEALVHGQTILPPMVHICDPGLNAIHHPAPDLLPDLVKVDDVGRARCHQMLPIVRNQIAQTLPPFFDRERTHAEIGQVAPGTTTPRQSIGKATWRERVGPEG